MTESLAIVGAGASSLSFTYAYVQKFTDEAGMPDTVFIFEKSGVFGPGAAYEQDLDTNLLNTKTGFITPFHDLPGDFYHWLNANEDNWKPSFPYFQQLENNYAPRALFGLYLQSRFAWVVKIAASKGMKVFLVQAEVIDIVPVHGSYRVFTRGERTVTAQHVLLACGSVASRWFLGKAPKNVFRTPYPLSALCDSISKEKSVAILGARLSCIDAVKGLIHKGHRGSISIHSRSGYFPSVRGIQGRLTPKVFTGEAIRLVASERTLRLEDVVALALRENEAQGGNGAAAFIVPKPPADIVRYLENEIVAASKPRLWQAILYSANSFIDEAWNYLSHHEQERLRSELMSVFMSYRVSVPPENAKLMLKYIASGKVEFIPGNFEVQYGFDGPPHKIWMCDGSQRSYDYIVWAAGFTSNLKPTEMPLVQNLLDRGMVSAHRFGGIRVDTKSHKVIDKNGQMAKSLRAVGELTNGQFFFTSALEILVNHSLRCVDNLIEEVKAADLESTGVS